MHTDGIIQRGNLVVTPFVTDKLLARAYFQYEKEGTLPIIYFQRVPTLKEFLDAHFENGKRVVFGCFRLKSPDEEPEFCGLGWVFDPIRMNGYTKAETGIGMFRCAGRDNLAFGRIMLEAFFSAKYGIDSIFGVTPEPNKLALRYAQKLGFSLHGPIPCYVTWEGKPAPGWISHLSREDWMERTR